jgi:hypothetical protein
MRRVRFLTGIVLTLIFSCSGMWIAASCNEGGLVPESHDDALPDCCKNGICPAHRAVFCPRHGSIEGNTSADCQMNSNSPITVVTALQPAVVEAQQDLHAVVWITIADPIQTFIYVQPDPSDFTPPPKAFTV